MAGADRAFVEALFSLPLGYCQGAYEGNRYGVTITLAANGKRLALFAEQLGGNNTVSCNFYRLGNGHHRLVPCEMAPEKVIDFVLRFVPGRTDPDPSSPS